MRISSFALAAVFCFSSSVVIRAAEEKKDSAPAKEAAKPVKEKEKETAKSAASEKEKGKEGKEKTSGKAKAVTKTVEGTFLGVEDGDFSYWNMKTADGKDITFFILHPDAAIEKVMKKPENFKGKKCKVTTKESMEELPDGGGKQKIEEIIGVVWVK